ncbi:hypothetical protein VTK73DRAFT_5117 [Phialemonium thermophilum]|uniref:Uncharacterized protein n=1 Tax=Phialemonium thermophilum TaxID=223376 RepID=A0ABR3WQ28_9PEZI
MGGRYPDSTVSFWMCTYRCNPAGITATSTITFKTTTPRFLSRPQRCEWGAANYHSVSHDTCFQTDQSYYGRSRCVEWIFPFGPWRLIIPSRRPRRVNLPGQDGPILHLWPRMFLPETALSRILNFYMASHKLANEDGPLDWGHNKQSWRFVMRYFSFLGRSPRGFSNTTGNQFGSRLK